MHTPEHKKRTVDNLSRAIGHLNSVKKMVEDDRDCTEVLIQIAAVKSAVGNIGKAILQEHLTHCIADAVETGDKSAITALNEAVQRLL